MISGHAPAGYITSALLFSKFKERGIRFKQFIWFGISGALLPDIDMFYFHLIDHRQHHHHSYFTHFPALWGTLLIISIIWLQVSQSSKSASLSFIFCLCGFIHLILDSIVGDIWWFAPFVNKSFAMFTVPALYKPWWLNFILHWSFALELSLVIWALLIHRKRSNLLL